MQKYVSIFTIILILTSCLEQVELPYRNLEPILVVDGEITNEAPPYNLRLSYSGRFISGSIVTSRLAVNGARVILTDDKGESVPFKQNIFEPGLYQTNQKFQCEIGRTYALTIEMPDGKLYKVKPQLMRPIAKITKITADKIPDFIRFYIDTKDPSESKDYYRWKSFSIALRYGCWAYVREDAGNILADTYINGNEIKQRMVQYSPINANTPNALHFIEVKQMSISEEAYLFWQQYEEQRTRTGSIFDPLPATIIGNVVNANDSKDFALGFFGVSGVSTKRFHVYPPDITTFKNVEVAISPPFIDKTPPKVNCQSAYPNYGPKPPENWDN
jgi:Domain of unknown function (DUF4249)